MNLPTPCWPELCCRACLPPTSHLQRNEEAAKEGQPLELFWRRQYDPQQGMFSDPPKDLQVGWVGLGFDALAWVGH